MNTRPYHRPYAHLSTGTKLLRWTLMWPIGAGILCAVIGLFWLALGAVGVPLSADVISIMCAAVVQVAFYGSAHLVYRGDSVATYYQSMIPPAARQVLNPVVVPFGHILNFLGLMTSVALASGACCCDDDD